MSDVDEDAAGALGRQRSIFSGMGRVRQIHQIREKWSTSRTKLLPPDAGSRRGAAKKYAATLRIENESDKERAGAFQGDPRRRHRALTASDLERYRSITQWLSGNGIDVAEAPASSLAIGLGTEVFDDVLDSLDALEKSVEGELAKMTSPTKQQQSDLLPRLETYGQDAPPTAHPSLCDYIVVVGPDVADIAAKNYWKRQENVFEATVAFACPPQCQFNAESIEHFCFPRGIQLLQGCQDDSTISEEFFVLLLSGGGAQGQTVQYAFCLKGFVRVPIGINSTSLIPICYCIISQLPLVSFFHDMLKRLLSNMTNDSFSAGSMSTYNVVSNEHSHYVDEVLRKLSCAQFHGKGSAITVDAFPAPEEPLLLSRRTIDEADGKHTMLLQWSLPLLLASLTIDQILQILAMLLTEMKVIVVSEYLSLLSSATLGLASMLQPLSWAGPLITVLPPLLHEYMEAPVPLICGVDTLPASYEVATGVAIVHLAEHRIILHPHDEVESSNLKIPGADDLCRDLDIFTSQIKQPKSECVVAFGVDVVIRRVRLHIQQLLDSCTRLEEQKGSFIDCEPASTSKSNELKFIQRLMQTQMYQKYRDDHPLATTFSCDNKGVREIDNVDSATTDGHLIEPECEENKQNFKIAVDTIFRIAFTGVNEAAESLESPPRDSSRQYDFAALLGWKSENFDPDSNSGEVDELRQPEDLADTYLTHGILIGSQVVNTSHSNGGNQFELSVVQYEQIQTESMVSDSDASFNPRVRSEFQSPIGKAAGGAQITFSEVEAEINLCQTDCEHIPLRRDDTETTLSLLGTTFSDTMLRSGGSFTNTEWLSESSDENFHDCNDSEEESRQSTFQQIAVSVQARKDGVGRNVGSSHHTTASCVKIQRTWRDWIARRRSPTRQQPLDMNYRSPLLYADTGPAILHRQMAILHEIDVLTRGVHVRKFSDTHDCTEGRVYVNQELSKLEWVQEFPALVGDAATELALIRRISSRVPSSDEGGQSLDGKLVTKIYFEGGATWRFRHDMAAHDFFCFLRWITVARLAPGLNEYESSISLGSAPLDRSEPSVSGPNSESALSVRSVRSIEVVSSSHDRDYIDKFKAALRIGFLVEKHGRTGKPHSKIIFSDAACSQLMWKKPPARTTKLSGSNSLLSKKSFFLQKGILVSDITTILQGKQTLVFNRSTAQSADEKLCLSIVSTTRTLDIRAYSSEDYELLMCGLSILVIAHGATQR